MKRFFFLPLVLWMAGVAAWAQQRYVIYPVPQAQQLTAGEARFTDRVNIVAEPGIDEATVARARQILAEHGLSASVSQHAAGGKTNLLLGINGSGQQVDNEVDRQGLDRSVFRQPKYDRHIVSLTADKKGRAQLLVVGEHTDAVFYGLATIEQMLDRGTKALPCVRFYDYADLRSRGVIEGYYGVPYNAEVTKDLFRFMARYKMNTYMYGAKSDPYHTRYWGEPYPTTITPEQQRIGYLTQDMLRDIVSVAHASKVNFIWAIHPGNAFVSKKSEDVIDRIMTKFQSMYDLGVRQFGVFVDDVGVPYDRPTQLFGAERLTQLQNSIDERWNKSGTALPADTVKPLQYVPQLYAYSWTTAERAQGFFESLSGTPKKIDVYITGANVWSVPNSHDLSLVSQWLGREVAWWWNYPCNDNDMTKLFPMDMYTNFHDETHINNRARMEPALKGTTTLIANPMQQGEASKIALFSMGDYAWNNAAFDNLQSWTAALSAIVGSKKEALRRVLPYLRYYDEDALADLVNGYKQSVEVGVPRPEALRRELTDVLAACRSVNELAVSPSESDRLFHEDIRPWLTKLEVMLQVTLDLLDGKPVANLPNFEEDKAFQFEVLNGMDESIALGVRTAEPAARVLRPFIDWLKEQKP